MAKRVKCAAFNTKVVGSKAQGGTGHGKKKKNDISLSLSLSLVKKNRTEQIKPTNTVDTRPFENTLIKNQTLKCAKQSVPAQTRKPGFCLLKHGSSL